MKEMKEMREKEKEKILKKILKKIENIIEIIADLKVWDCYEILKLDIIINDDDELELVDIVVFYRDKNDFDGVFKLKFDKITTKRFIKIQ